MSRAEFRSCLVTEAPGAATGVGGPTFRLGRMLCEEFPPSLILGPEGDVAGIPRPFVRPVPRPAWRKALAGTRLHRLQLASIERRRILFDRRAARRLPPCRLAVLENTACLETLRRAKALGARTLLLEHNPELGSKRRELVEERRRWGGDVPWTTRRLVRRSEAEWREADRVVVFSELTRASFLAAGLTDDRIRRARLGVDPVRFSPAPAPAPGFTVAFVGWLMAYKGYPYLVEAFRDAAIPGSRLLLHGGTGRPHPHRLIARLRGDSDVEVVRGPVEETYARSSVLVLPSVSEGFGLVVLEGMACGLPVIVSDRTGAAEVVTNGRDGFVVPARDPDAIRERLVALHRDPAARERMGRAARATALEHPWSRFLSDMREIVSELLSG